jgi:hypothetical protein
MKSGPFLCSNPPKPKKNWNHSDRVLVYYEANPEAGLTDRFGIAYYHYAPPFMKEPEWVDFDCSSRVPTLWWPLPKVDSTNITKVVDKL